MIIVQLCGGLGNQMFQYAFGRRLSLDAGVPLKLDIGLLQRDPLRKFACGQFRIAATIASDQEIASFGLAADRSPGRLGRLKARLFGAPKHIVREAAFHFDPGALQTRERAYITGYWQSEQYFCDIADVIREDFQPIAPLSPERSAILHDIAACNAISVHVRRGDYVTNPVTSSVHGNCPADWYDRTMALLAEPQPDPRFFVFSDDPAWCRAHLQPKWPVTFIEPQPDGRDHEDIFLMSRCRHHIIANSSFSWWGAWLNPRHDKQVIAPRRWFKTDQHDTRDVIPASWQCH